MPPQDEDQLIVKRLAKPGSRIERVYELDELQGKIVGQWVRVTSKDKIETWYRISEIQRSDPSSIEK